MTIHGKVDEKKEKIINEGKKPPRSVTAIRAAMGFIASDPIIKHVQESVQLRPLYRFRAHLSRAPFVVEKMHNARAHIVPRPRGSENHARLGRKRRGWKKKQKTLSNNTRSRSYLPSAEFVCPRRVVYASAASGSHLTRAYRVHSHVLCVLYTYNPSCIHLSFTSDASCTVRRVPTGFVSTKRDYLASHPFCIRTRFKSPLKHK